MRSIYEIDPTKIVSFRKPVFNSYDNKPLSKFNCDDFANYIMDNTSVVTHIVEENYFTPFIQKYLNSIPNLQGINERVYLYGVFEVIKSIMRGKTNNTKQINKTEL